MLKIARFLIRMSIIIILLSTLGTKETLSLDFSPKGTIVRLVPETSVVSTRETFTISARIEDVDDLYAFDFEIEWNSTLFEYVDHVAKTPVSTYPDGVLYEQVIIIFDDVNASSGKYRFVATSLSPAPSFYGSCTVFEITFRVKQPSLEPESNVTSSIVLSKHTLTSSTSVQIMHLKYDADVTIVRFISADVNYDWIVDIGDIVLCVSSYRTTPLDTNWNPDCDLAEPFGFIDIFDIVTVSSYYGKEYARAPPEGVRFSLREHSFYCPSYSPDIRFLKPSSGVLRIDSYQAGTSSMGYGAAFVVVPRDWLNGKYIRFNWSGYFSYSQPREGIARAWIYDGEYDRTNDADFPEGASIPTKGAGLLQTLRVKNTYGSWGPETVDVLVDVAAGTEPKCTMFFLMGDGWYEQTVFLDIDWFQINQGPGGDGTLAVENFDAAVIMERTGTYGDYGYISSGDINH
jgi:hypothetical protein